MVIFYQMQVNKNITGTLCNNKISTRHKLAKILQAHHLDNSILKYRCQLDLKIDYQLDLEIDCQLNLKIDCDRKIESKHNSQINLDCKIDWHYFCPQQRSIQICM